MNYDPRYGPPPQQGYPHPQQPGPYQQPPPGQYPQQPPHQGGYYDEPPHGRRRDDSSESIAHIIRIVVGVVIAIFTLHVLFVVFDANQGNGFVSFIYTMAQVFVLGLGDVFTPDDELLGVVLNYALAALVWAVGGKLVIKALRR
ncbi:hypothetical protein [Saccharopolyspora endophytica]|uniref:hypothetical protein n=1 Tax=Saccharopolyspora endophytica TaxID=543886 RepID=UPI001FE91E8F|nr:hypothetical protein [Saccharopolyspora endophytica]